jgi:NhaP-type Na+/H+ or K+/H+ antiporter
VEFFKNPWFIGIVGGILSGIIVFFITKYLFSRRDNREYTQKIITANQEVIYAIRPGISEGIIPTQDILQALIAATARKYTVDPKDLHDAKTFTDVLIKEVMDSSFLPASSKAEFCKSLAEMKPPQIVQVASPKPITELADYKRRMVTMISGMLGMMSAAMTVSFAFRETHSSTLITIVPTVLTLLIVIATTYTMWIYQTKQRRFNKKLASKVDTIDTETAGKDSKQ